MSRYLADLKFFKTGYGYSCSSCDILRTENERLKKENQEQFLFIQNMRLAGRDEYHHACLLVAVREEDAKVCAGRSDSLIRDDNIIAGIEANKCYGIIRALPLPDKKAEKIRKVLEAAKLPYIEVIGDEFVKVHIDCMRALDDAWDDLETEE